MFNEESTKTKNRAVLNALNLLLARLLLVAGFALLTWLISNWISGQNNPFPPGILLSGLYMFPVNLISLLLVRNRLKRDDQSPKELLSPRPGKCLRDLIIGFVWQLVLFVPFTAALMATGFILFGSDMFQAFETVFYNPSNEIAWSPVVMLMVGCVSVATFAPLNAPVEELIYRYYVPTKLSLKWPYGVSVLISAAAFGLQHVFYATSLAGAFMYFAAFTAFGATASIIVRYQRRLFPILTAHFSVNLMLSLPAVILPILILSGVIKR